MIGRLLRAKGEQRKLLFSLGTNFLTRVPGAVGVLWLLPLFRFGLGTEAYGTLLASGALATATTFLIGGFNVVGRRLIGEAYAENDRRGEANGFASMLVANTLCLLVGLVIILAYCGIRGVSSEIIIISILPAFGIFFTMFDNARSAYNEQYVTATLQFVLQTTIFTIAFLVPATRQNLILAALVLQGHYILSSLITFGLLLRHRPYLFRGHAVTVWRVARDGTMFALADGLLMTSLSLSVVWLQATASATTSAWFATIVRLFQTFLVPVILLLMPLSSYIRLRWNGKTLAQRQFFTKATLWIGLAYGTFVAAALMLVSTLYVNELLHLPAPGRWYEMMPVFLLFGAIVAYRGYSSVAYVVLDETTHLSFWTTVALTAAVTLGAISSFAIDPLNVINVYALVAALSMIFVLFWNVARFVRTSLPE